MRHMRTTLTLDNDLAQRLEQNAARDGKPFKVIVNDTLRAGLGLRDKPSRKAEKIALRTSTDAFGPNITPAGLSR